MRQKYKDASGKLPNQKQLLERLGLELNDLIDVVEGLMQRTPCNNSLTTKPIVND